MIDGKTLVYILDRRANLQDMFLRLTSHCSSVLCCRATPLQKAYIVKIVKENLGMHTLAVGDGANDVSMIQVSSLASFLRYLFLGYFFNRFPSGELQTRTIWIRLKIKAGWPCFFSCN